MSECRHAVVRSLRSSYFDLADDENVPTRGCFHYVALAQLALIKSRSRKPHALETAVHRGVDPPRSARRQRPPPRHVVETKLMYTQPLVGVQEYDRGMALLHEYFESAHRQWGDDHSLTISIMTNLGVTLGTHLGRLKESATWLERAYNAKLRLCNERQSSIHRSFLTRCYIRQGRFLEALHLARLSFDQEFRARGPDAAHTTYSLREVCSCLRLVGRLDTLADDLDSCVQTFRALDDASTGGGDLFLSRGNVERATTAFNSVLVAYQEALGPTHPSTRSIVYAQLFVLECGLLEWSPVGAMAALALLDHMRCSEQTWARTRRGSTLSAMDVLRLSKGCCTRVPTVLAVRSVFAAVVCKSHGSTTRNIPTTISRGYVWPTKALCPAVPAEPK
ncbi:Aste57867_14751 [Aphanomyces stellatus]|uniref:Aste57867_14751 protein n=1 Tax=Aphanomyces stellatus TaxID=120398 RepID=A0A485L1I3_9STRA|nr:hypothetical protein As57867_014696 [Aphanomyces stellatus]VFT91569.1 Aste57867_14751 [Aphanomyces stellatus]